MKRTIRLTESDLHRVISESVRQILNEDNGTNRLQRDIQNILGALENVYYGYLRYLDKTDDDDDRNVKVWKELYYDARNYVEQMGWHVVGGLNFDNSIESQEAFAGA